MPYRALPRTRLHVAARTDIGRCRNHNEDTFRVTVLGTGDLLEPEPASAESHEVSARLAGLGYALGVYDGCGGRSSGDAASSIAAKVLHDALCREAPPPPGALAEWLGAAVEEAGQKVWEAARDNPAWGGMGTTATVAVLVGGRLEIAQVGDSRAYLLDRAGLRQLTRDDTLLNELLAAGKLSPEEAESFPHRNVITKALGMRERTGPTITSVGLEDGDRLLLCTDGVTACIADADLAELLRRYSEPDACCRAIVEATYRAGAPDNLTMVVADVLVGWT
jgi:protein phosphatase